MSQTFVALIPQPVRPQQVVVSPRIPTGTPAVSLEILVRVERHLKQYRRPEAIFFHEAQRGVGDKGSRVVIGMASFIRMGQDDVRAGFLGSRYSSAEAREVSAVRNGQGSPGPLLCLQAR